MICGCRTVGVRGLSHHVRNRLMHMLTEHLWTRLGDRGGGGRSLGVYTYCQTRSPGLYQDRWQMSCLEVTGTRWVLASCHTRCPKTPPCLLQTHLFTLSFPKRGLQAALTAIWMVTSSYWPKKRKLRRCGPVPGRGDLWLTFFFFLKKSRGCVFKIVSPLGHISCLIAESFPPLLLLPASCIGCSFIVMATAKRKQEEPDVWHQMELSSDSPSIMVWCHWWLSSSCLQYLF